MKASEAKWAVMAAMAAMIGMAACQKAEKSDTAKAQAKTGDSASFPEKVGEEARQTTRDVEEGTEKAVKKTEEEARQTSRDIKEGTDKAVKKTEEEARQTTRDMSEGTDKAVKGTKGAMATAAAMPGDKGKTKSDEALINKIRTSWRTDEDKEEISASNDVKIKATDGQVTLEGTVPSKQISQGLAEEAQTAAGKGKVTNKLKVAERVGTGSSE